MRYKIEFCFDHAEILLINFMILFELPSIHVCLSDWFKACIIILPSQLIMRR